MNDLGPRAKELITFTRARSGPTEADAARVETALFAAIAAASPIVATAKSPSAAVSTGLVAKIVVGIAVVGALGAGAYLRVASTDRQRPSNLAIQTPAPPPSLLPAAAIPNVNSGDPEVPVIDVSALPSTRTKSAPAREEEVGAELALIDAAQRSLAQHDPSRALELIEEHRRRFPSGRLVEERAAAHILALCDLHRDSEARAEAATFLRDRPKSPQIPSIQRSCAGSEK